MINIKTKIVATLTLVFIITLLVSNFYIGVTSSLNSGLKDNKKITHSVKTNKKTTKFKYTISKKSENLNKKSVRKNEVSNKPKTEPIYIAQNDVKKVDEVKKVDKSHHHATWYRTEGSLVHREHPTAAYNFTPKGTKLLVINALSGDSCIVEVTDRMGKSIPNRIDLSHSAFGQIAKHSHGVAKVIVKILQ
jgi:rare lipoprotein A (peptidoglycan hydrolase)